MICLATNKVCFLFEEEAQKEADYWSKANFRTVERRLANRWKLRPYYCQRCGQFHLTSQPLAKAP